MKTRLFLPLFLWGLAIICKGAQTPAALVSAVVQADASTQIIERGQDFAVIQQVTITTNADGSTSSSSSQFTLLQNCLHYQENGEWQLSEDIVEPFPGGAIARRGPNKTIFSTDLNAEAVFDIQTAEGQRIRGGVRAIQLTDIATGRSVVLATVKPSAPGVVVPPNQVLYASGFDGLDADVLCVWRHNSVSQNVILKKKPVLPAGMVPATTRLEVVSELVESPPPVLNSVLLREPGKPDLRDDVIIRLGSLQAIRGKAYAVTAGRALLLTGEPFTDKSRCDSKLTVTRRV